MPYEVKLVKHKEVIEKLLKLHEVVFGEYISPELWKWLYLRNPLAKQERNIVIAEEKGEIIGARPLMLLELWLKDEKIKAAQPSSTMVHPEHRRKGVFTKMNELAIDYCRARGYSLFFNFPGPMSFPGYLKQGWKLVAKRGSLIKLLDPVSIFSVHSSKLVGVPLGLLYEFITHFKSRRLPSISPYTIYIFDRVNEKFIGIDDLRDRETINLVRDIEYLKWRFDSHPHYRYKYIVAMRDNEVCGYMVLTTRKGNRFLIGFIVDYVFQRGQKDCFFYLLETCLEVFQKENCQYVNLLETCDEFLNRELQKHYNFVLSKNLFYRKFFKDLLLVVRALSEDIKEKINIHDGNKWWLTRAFIDSA